MVALADLAGARSLVIVPMLRDNNLVGAIAIYRKEVQPFTDKQIELVSNFAKQAVIVIENTRLLKELRKRTDDLSESLEQQTATSEVLEVISSSRGDVAPVLPKLLENAIRVCGAKFGNLLLYENDAFRIASTHDAPAAWADKLSRDPIIRPSATAPLGRIISTKQIQHVADMKTEQSYLDREPAAMAVVDLAGARTILAVPMLRNNKLIGTINIYRQEMRPFSSKQIELLQNFAVRQSSLLKTRASSMSFVNPCSNKPQLLMC